jgi:redox-sensing transcriptional repressor
MEPESIPEASRRRISRYMRCLGMALDSGKRWVTSSYLAGRCMKSAESVRRDLASLGYLGKRGSGYDARRLLESLREFMGLAPPPDLALVGVGRLGEALLASGIPGGPYRFTAAFDSDGRKTGRKVGDVEVRPLSDMPGLFGDRADSTIAVVAVGRGRLQGAVDALSDAGCRWALSFTLEPVEVPAEMVLRYMEIATELDQIARMMAGSGDSNGPCRGRGSRG